MSLLDSINKNTNTFRYSKLTEKVVDECIKTVFNKPTQKNSWVFHCGIDTYMGFEVMAYMDLIGISGHFHVEKKAKYRYHVDLFKKSGLYKMTVEYGGITRVFKGTQVIYYSNTAGEGLGKFLKRLNNEND